jgi:HK97 family phage major capsid protein
MSITQERINALTTTRARVWEEAKGFLEDLKGAEMSGEQAAQWARYNERIDALAAEHDELIERDRRETEAGQIREAQAQAFGREPDEKREAQDWNARIRSWIQGEEKIVTRDEDNKLVNGLVTNVVGVMRERELLRAGASPDEIRAMTWDTGSSASVVPTILDRRLYEVLEANIAFLRMPTWTITTESGGPMDFGRLATHGAATQVSGQGTTIGGTDPALGKLTLTPAKYAQLVEIANEVITDNGVDLIAVVSRDVGYAVGRRVNQALVASLNSAAVVGSAGTVASGGSLITPTYETLVNLQYSVVDAYRNNNSGWLAADSTAGTIRKLRDGAGGTVGAPIWQPSTQAGISGQRQPDSLLGFPFWTDPNVAAQGSNAKILYFGDWNGYVARFVGNPMIERNDAVGFKEDEATFRGKWRAAGGVQDVTAINVMKMSVS